jgi:hypothetical protein
MKHLKAYVDRANKWGAIFNRKPFDLNDPADRQRIASKIDSELSPENLTCDGELSQSQVRAKYKELTTVAEELLKLDPSVQFYEFS